MQTSHFRRRQITIPLCVAPHVHYYAACRATSQPHALTVTELIGSGLAILPVQNAERLGCFTLVHVTSGLLLSTQAVATVVEAGRWIREVAPLYDWTQPAHTMRPARHLAEQVEAARLAALEATAMNQRSRPATCQQDFLHADRDE